MLTNYIHNTRIRRTAERTRNNALGMLDLQEKLIYVGQGDRLESISRKIGEVVEGYWLYVFRPKTNSYGWYIK